MRKMILIFLVLVVLVGCDDDDDIKDPTATSANQSPTMASTFLPVSTPSVVPVIPSPLPPVANLPPTSILMVVDESASIKNCPMEKQQLRHEIPQFYLAFNLMTQNPNLKMAVSTFDAGDYYQPLFNFDDNLRHSFDWFPGIDRLKINEASGEDYSTTFIEGIQSLQKTESENQVLLLLTDGSHKDPAKSITGIYNAINGSNQKIKVLLLCPELGSRDDIKLWTKLDDDKDQVKVFRTNDSNWFQALTDDVLGEYMKIGAFSVGWMQPNQSVDFAMPADRNFHVSAVSLTRGNIVIEPTNENLDRNITPNSFYFYQDAKPNDNCQPYQGRITNYTRGETFYWIIEEKTDVSLDVQVISQPNQNPVKLATTMRIHEKSNSDLINFLSCYKPNLELQTEQEKLNLIHSQTGYCIDGWCAEPSRLVAYWEWSGVTPPLIDSFSVINPSTGEKVFSKYGQDITPDPFIYRFQVNGPYQGDFEPFLKVDFSVWYSNKNIEDITIQSISDKSSDDLANVGQVRNTDGDDAPLCPLPATGKSFVVVPFGDLSKNTQIVKNVDALTTYTTPQLSKYFIEIYRATGWHTNADDDGSTPHCNYDTFQLQWDSTQWECNFSENENNCHRVLITQP